MVFVSLLNQISQADSGTVAQVQQLLGVAKDDVQQCIENMEKRLEIAVKAAADRGPHKYALPVLGDCADHG